MENVLQQTTEVMTEERTEKEIIKAQVKQINYKNSNLTLEEQEIFNKHLIKYYQVFAIDPKKLEIITIVTHKINIGDTQPIKQRAYQISPLEEEVIRKEVIKIKKNDII